MHTFIDILYQNCEQLVVNLTELGDTKKSLSELGMVQGLLEAVLMSQASDIQVKGIQMVALLVDKAAQAGFAFDPTDTRPPFFPSTPKRDSFLHVNLSGSGLGACPPALRQPLGRHPHRHPRHPPRLRFHPFLRPNAKNY